MNIILLIIGIFLIIIPIILITINTNDSPRTNIRSEGNRLTVTTDIPLEDEIENMEIKEKKEFDVDFQNHYFKDSRANIKKIELYQDSYNMKKDDFESSEVNTTDEIIKMHGEGLSSNEIAKKLGKGVREIDIILKVNNIEE